MPRGRSKPVPRFTPRAMSSSPVCEKTRLRRAMPRLQPGSAHAKPLLAARPPSGSAASALKYSRAAAQGIQCTG